MCLRPKRWRVRSEICPINGSSRASSTRLNERPTPTQHGRQAHHGVVKEQHEKAGQDHQDRDGHLPHAVKHLGGQRQWARIRGEGGNRVIEWGCSWGVVPADQGISPSDQRASTTSPESSGTGSRRNCWMCSVSSSGCSNGPKCSPPGSSTGLQLGSAWCRNSYELMKCEFFP